jgi:hypothetical protein
MRKGRVKLLKFLIKLHGAEFFFEKQSVHSPNAEILGLSLELQFGVHM